MNGTYIAYFLGFISGLLFYSKLLDKPEVLNKIVQNIRKQKAKGNASPNFNNNQENIIQEKQIKPKRKRRFNPFRKNKR